MSDTYTVSPSNIFPGVGNVIVTYTSGNFINGTTYTLKTLSGTTLGTKSISIVTNTSFSGPTSNQWAIAGDSSGFIYTQVVSTKVINIYNPSGTLINTITAPSQFITTCANKSDPNIIYWAGGSSFSVFTVSTRTFTTYTTPNFWGSVYNQVDGYVYCSELNITSLYKVNPSNGSYTQIFTGATGDFFQGVAIGNDGNLYCIKRSSAAIFKFTTSGTSLGLFVSLPYASGAGLAYDSTRQCFYAQVSTGTVYQISNSGSYITIFTAINSGSSHWGSYFNPFTNTYYLNENTITVYIIKFNLTITYTFSSDLLIYTDTTIQLYNGATPFGVNITIIIPFPCFLEGTKILRMNQETDDEEYVPVETLRRGDLIKTIHGYKAIELIGSKEIHPLAIEKKSSQLYWFRKSKIAGLTEDLCVTGDHCILHKSISSEKKDQVLEYMGDIYITEGHYRVPAFLDDRSEPYKDSSTATIWHFALENPNIYHNYGVMANGILVESSSLHYMYKYSNMRLI